jgi:hypothetical protein
VTAELVGRRRGTGGGVVMQTILEKMYEKADITPLNRWGLATGIPAGVVVAVFVGQS